MSEFLAPILVSVSQTLTVVDCFGMNKHKLQSVIKFNMILFTIERLPLSSPANTHRLFRSWGFLECTFPTHPCRVVKSRVSNTERMQRKNPTRQPASWLN